MIMNNPHLRVANYAVKASKTEGGKVVGDRHDVDSQQLNLKGISSKYPDCRITLSFDIEDATTRRSYWYEWQISCRNFSSMIMGP